MAAFALQFPIEQVREIAARYAYEDDSEVIATGRTASERGHYTHEEFLAVGRWKSPRSTPLLVQNDAESIETLTRTALSETAGERERMKALTTLTGVGFPIASVLLHLAYPERYPILDGRALQALGVREPRAFSFRFWQSYVDAWRDVAARADVDGRTLDQALWQWSKERGEPL